MDMKPFGGGVWSERVLAANCLEAIATMDDVDFVAAAQESASEAIDVGSIAAKAMTAEECRDHAEFQRRPPVAALSRVSEASRVLPDRPLNGKPDWLCLRPYLVEMLAAKSTKQKQHAQIGYTTGENGNG